MVTYGMALEELGRRRHLDLSVLQAIVSFRRFVSFTCLKNFWIDKLLMPFATWVQRWLAGCKQVKGNPLA